MVDELLQQQSADAATKREVQENYGQGIQQGGATRSNVGVDRPVGDTGRGTGAIETRKPEIDIKTLREDIRSQQRTTNSSQSNEQERGSEETEQYREQDLPEQTQGQPTQQENIHNKDENTEFTQPQRLQEKNEIKVSATENAEEANGNFAEAVAEVNTEKQEESTEQHVHVQELEKNLKKKKGGRSQGLKPRLKFNNNLKKAVLVGAIIFFVWIFFGGSSKKEDKKQGLENLQTQQEKLETANDENNQRAWNEYAQTAKDERNVTPLDNTNLPVQQQSGEQQQQEQQQQGQQQQTEYQAVSPNGQDYAAEREQIRVNRENAARERAIQRVAEEKAVFLSPATTNSGNWGSLGGRSQQEQPQRAGASLETQTTPQASQMDRRINNFLDRLGGGSGGGNGGNEQLQAQNDRINFFNATDSGRGMLQNTRQAPVSPYLLPCGTFIPCTLVGGVNSDLPGDVAAAVTEDVYDWKNPNIVLIPQGTRVFGSYNSKVAWAQHRIQVSWKRVIFPDGSTLELNGMSGVDKRGYSGLKDKQYAHYGKLLTASVMTAAFSSVGLLFDDKATTYVNGTTTNPRSEFAKEIGSSLGRMGERLFSKNLNIPPTILIRPATRFNIMVNADIPFYTGFRKK